MNEREVQAFLSGLPKHVPQRTAKFRAGQIISDSMHRVIRRGRGGKRTRRHLRRGAGRARRAAQFHRHGECFGICNLLVDEPLQTVLRCAEETTVRFWEKEALVAAMRGDAALAMAYAALCNAKIQFLLSRIEMLTMQSCRGKVLAFLLTEKREDGVILLRGTRDELASRLSVSRAALYRELSALQSGGYLEVGESRLRVLNTSALEKLLYGV